MTSDTYHSHPPFDLQIHDDGDEEDLEAHEVSGIMPRGKYSAIRVRWCEFQILVLNGEG